MIDVTISVNISNAVVSHKREIKINRIALKWNNVERRKNKKFWNCFQPLNWNLEESWGWERLWKERRNEHNIINLKWWSSNLDYQNG